MTSIHPFLRKIQSISAAIALLTLIGGILFALIIAGVSYWMQRTNDIQDLKERAQQVSDQINYIAEVLLNKGDLSSVQRIVENVSTDRGILFIAIVDDDLKVLASSQHDLLGRPLSEYADKLGLATFQRVITLGQTEFVHRAERGHFEIIAPITLSSPSRTQPLMSGAVTVSFRDDPLIWNPRESFWQHFQLSLVLTTVAIAILYGILRLRVTSPLEQLTRTAERLGKGELGIQIPVRSTNEIGRLGVTFNAMSASLAEQRRALQASEERYLRIFHSSPNSLIVVDAAGTIVDVNATFLAQMVGTSDPQIWIGKSVAELPIVRQAELHPEVIRLLKEATPFKRWKVPISFPGPGGPSFFNLSGIPLFDNAHALTGAVIAVEDITAEQRLEAQLIQSQKMESLGVLAGGVAHDFNNILTGILGYASLLKARLHPGDPNCQAVNVIEKSSLRARDLIQQLLGFARRTPPMKTVVEVNGLVSEVVSLLQKGVGPQVIVKADLDSANSKIVADPGQIHQALMNLCVNARDALSPEGGSIFLRTRLLSRSSSSGREQMGHWVEIAVQDTGSGIPAESVPRIFEPFFTTKEVGKGTGLGLSVTYGIVKENGGELTVQSEPGKGSTFLIRFPITEDQAPWEKKAGPSEELQGGMRKVLLVDDERDLLDLERSVLAERGFHILTAQSGEEAVRLYQRQREKICLVVLDLLMPGMDGWSTYQKLQEIDPGLKVLFTSGYAGKDVQGHLGIFPFLKKPFQIEEFVRAVQKVLQAGRRNLAFRLPQ